MEKGCIPAIIHFSLTRRKTPPITFLSLFPCLSVTPVHSAGMSTGQRARTRLKPWRTSGGIRIRPIRNRSGAVSYRAEIPESITGQRLLRQFKTPDEAESFAAVMQVQRENSGLAAFSIDDTQREDARQALEILRPLPDATLLQAAQFFVKHYRPVGGDISVSDLIKQFMADKRRQNLRPRSISDLDRQH